METKNTVTAGQVLSATVRYSNMDDAARKYDISAEVSIHGGTVTSIDGGQAHLVEGGETAATFSSYGDNNLSLSLGSTGKATVIEVSEAVCDFMQAVKDSLEANDNI